jgi:metallo-beta-lactamase family protein
VTEIFANRLRRELGYDAYAPYSGAEFDLLSGKMLSTPAGVPVVRESGGIKPSTLRARSVFARLVAAGQRLMTVIRHNEGGANKDLAKFTDQINALCDKWDR